MGRQSEMYTYIEVFGKAIRKKCENLATLVKGERAIHAGKVPPRIE